MNDRISAALPDGHPLRFLSFVTRFPAPLGEMPSPDWLATLLRADAHTPLKRDEQLRTAVRDMLRRGGYKPTGRGKPASEYLVRAAGDGALSSINLAVDACNVVSLHSGFPISVIDIDRTREPLRIAIAAAGERFVFNTTGQEIDLDGLLCVYDADGPCANAVKDSERTKTKEETVRTVSVVWGCEGHEAHLEATVAWYVSLLERAGAEPGPATGSIG